MCHQVDKSRKAFHRITLAWQLRSDLNPDLHLKTPCHSKISHKLLFPVSKKKGATTIDVYAVCMYTYIYMSIYIYIIYI